MFSLVTPLKPGTERDGATRNFAAYVMINDAHGDEHDNAMLLIRALLRRSNAHACIHAISASNAELFKTTV